MDQNTQSNQVIISSSDWSAIITHIAHFSAHFTRIGGDINQLNFTLSGRRGNIIAAVETSDDNQLFLIRNICENTGYFHSPSINSEGR